jgi:hypothetical protein
MSSAATALANATGPRTTGKATVVNNCMLPFQGMVAAIAVGPSSQGRENTKWSFIESAWKPRPCAVFAYSISDWREKPFPSKSISGR